jgi:DNA repair exonuclease SbcCD ATPase subunit
VKLRKIRLNNVRRFTDPVEISGIASGLNVLAAPNENGKSTIFDALHTLFFKGHRSWDKEVSSLAPHAGGDPEVGLELELGGQVFKVEKRWAKSRKGEARVFRDGSLLKQGDDAEDWLSAALKSPKDGGPAGLLWVRQGILGLENDDASLTARRDLLSSVAGEVEAMTGGRRMETARRLCSEELERYLTKSGKPKTGGPLKEAEELVADLGTKHDELSAKASRLRAEIDRRNGVRRELAAIEDPEDDRERKERLQSAEAAFSEAQRHAETLEKEIESEKSRFHEVGRAQDKLKVQGEAITEAKQARDLLAGQVSIHEERKLARRDAETEHADAARRFEETEKALVFATETLRHILQAKSAASAAERRAELTQRLARAEGLRQKVETAKAAADIEIDTKTLQSLEELDAQIRTLKHLRASEAASVTMHYDEGISGCVVINDAALADGIRFPVPGGAAIDIAGVGRLVVETPTGSGETDIEDAERALADRLHSMRLQDIAMARESGGKRQGAEAQLRDAKAALAAEAPDGIDALRKQIAALPEEVANADELPDPAEAEQAERDAKAARDTVILNLEKARERLSYAKSEEARAAAAVEAAEARVTRSRNILDNLEELEAEIEILRQQLPALEAALEEAGSKRKEVERTAPDLDAATAALERARSVVERADRDRQELRLELQRLDTAIDLYSGEAVDEELADVATRLEQARDKLAEIEFEVAVLQRLDSALEAARAAARDRYVEPVLSELVPLIRLFWPEAELHLDADNVLPTALIRAGTEEDFDVLSGGTKEQIALLVRLAFARMLAKSGDAAPIILDDAIVYTDDDRIERMFDTLTREARDQQIIVFTCRQKAFRDLGGRSLSIAPARPAMASID